MDNSDKRVSGVKKLGEIRQERAAGGIWVREIGRIWWHDLTDLHDLVDEVKVEWREAP